MKDCLPRGMKTSPKGKKNRGLFGTKKEHETTKFIPLNKHEQILYGQKLVNRTD